MDIRICDTCINSEWQKGEYETACLYCHYIGDTVEPGWVLTCFEEKGCEDNE